MVPGLDGDDAPGPSAPATQSSSPSETDSTIPEGESPDSGASTAHGLEQAEVDGITTVLRAIDSGDPLPFEEDGGTFQNREGLLPSQPLGYYREYTVETPGSPDRGARRLVIGEGGETYYTDDHYASFTRIEPADFL